MHYTRGGRAALRLDERYRSETLGGRPILELAARIWEPDRYEAFRLCYGAMRAADDLVDDRKSQGTPLSVAEKSAMGAAVTRSMLDDQCGPEDLARVRERFAIPRQPWERWTRSMLYDLDHDGFRTFLEYRRYAEGAAVAPGTIFMHLCGVRRAGDRYQPPAFDARHAARPLAMFCYVVHIVRDFEADQRARLNFFPDPVLARHGLARDDLAQIAAGGERPAAFRGLLGEYCRIAAWYGREARDRLDRVAPLLEEPYRVSLELVYGLYRQIYEKARACREAFATEKLIPTGDEMRERIAAILRQ